MLIKVSQAIQRGASFIQTPFEIVPQPFQVLNPSPQNPDHALRRLFGNPARGNVSHVGSSLNSGFLGSFDKGAISRTTQGLM